VPIYPRSDISKDLILPLLIRSSLRRARRNSNRPSVRPASHTQGTKSHMVSGPFARFLFYVLCPPRGQIIFQFPIYDYKYIPPSSSCLFFNPPPPDFQSFSLTPVHTEHGHRRRSPPISTNLHRQATHPGRQQTHLNLNLHPPATDVHHTSPASGTSAFHSLSSPIPIRLSP